MWFKLKKKNLKTDRKKGVEGLKDRGSKAGIPRHSFRKTWKGTGQCQWSKAQGRTLEGHRDKGMCLFSSVMFSRKTGSSPRLRVVQGKEQDALCHFQGERHSERRDRATSGVSGTWWTEHSETPEKPGREGAGCGDCVLMPSATGLTNAYQMTEDEDDRI